jgi:hypothetical protein
MIMHRIFKYLTAFSLLLTAVTLEGQDSWFGRKKENFVYATISPSAALIEYCSKSGSGKRYTDFDTLLLSGETYTGQRCRIKMKGNKLIFYPGKIVLTTIQPYDTSLSSQRIEGYQNRKTEGLKLEYEWINRKDRAIINDDWFSQKLPINEIPEKAYRIVDSNIVSIGDSVKNLGNKFDSVIITDSRLISRRVLVNTSDKREVASVWNNLAGSRIEIRSFSWFYIAQGIALTITFAALYPEYIFLVTPGSMMISFGLYVIEDFIGERFVSGKTFRITFYNDAVEAVKARVRNGYILNNFYYKYRLSGSIGNIPK